LRWFSPTNGKRLRSSARRRNHLCDGWTKAECLLWRGVSAGTAQGLEKYADEIRKLPWGSGSSMLGEEDGHFFCALIGDRLFLRFLPKGALEPKRDNLECLRLIACPEDLTAQPIDLNAAYSAWETARADIFNDWTRRYRSREHSAASEPRIAGCGRTSAPIPAGELRTERD